MSTERRRARPGAKIALLGLWMSIAAMAAGCASVGKDIEVPPSARGELQRLASKFGICSATAAIVKDRKLFSVEAAQGCAAESPLMPDSVFEAASLSKPVFAYVVLKLVQQGKLDLDAPVVKYLPQGYGHQSQPYLSGSKAQLFSDPRLQSVTVRMALNHTSGLPNWSGGPLAFDFQPGEKWQYSGEGYVLLQRAVEALTKETLDELMARQVFKPLGMTRSQYTRTAQLEQHIVPGKTRDGQAVRPWHFTAGVSAFTLHTSAHDYGVFLAALLNDPVTLKQIVSHPVSVNPKLNMNWGLGWGLEQDKDDVFIWHWGNNSGYRAFVIASPRSGDGVVMFTNSDSGLALAQPLSEQVMKRSNKVFRFHLLRDGLANYLCEIIDICL